MALRTSRETASTCSMIDHPRDVSNGLWPAVRAFLAPLDMAGCLQRIEQAHDGRTVERQRGGKILLAHRRRRARDIDQRQPGGLGQAEWLQAAIHRTPPLPRRPGDQAAKAVAKPPLVLRHHPPNCMAYQYMACHLSWQPGSQWWSLPALDRRSVARADAE